MLMLFPFYKWADAGRERQNNSPRTTQFVSGSAGILASSHSPHSTRALCWATSVCDLWSTWGARTCWGVLGGHGRLWDRPFNDVVWGALSGLNHTKALYCMSPPALGLGPGHTLHRIPVETTNRPLHTHVHQWRTVDAVCPRSSLPTAASRHLPAGEMAIALSPQQT